jgi:uncharacterized protein YegL
VDPSLFRKRCLEELEAARNARVVGGAGIDLSRLAESLACFANLQAVRSSSDAATKRIAEELLQGGFSRLAYLLHWKPDGATPLIAFLGDYFFRREVEQDEALFRSLTFTTLKQIEEKQDRGLHMMQALHQAVLNLAERNVAPTARAPAVGAVQPTSFPFSEKELQENSEPRLPCVLLVDVSSSMAGERIAALNHGLEVYRTELMADNLASQRVEVAVAAFGTEVELVCPFVTAEQFRLPQLKAKGKTAMGAALNHAVDMIEFRRRQYRRHGVGSFRPWIFLLTDGTPTDEWRAAARRKRDGEANGTFFFYAVGVEDANYETLRELTSRPVFRLEGLRFRDLFRWLSQSQRAVSRSSPGREGTVSLLDPSRPGGWAVIG